MYIIDDCSASRAFTKKKDVLSSLAFSGRHAEQSVCVLTQKYNSVLKDLREQTRWVCFFHCKDCISFQDCLRENDVIPTREQGVLVRQQLAETKHAKLLLKNGSDARQAAGPGRARHAAEGMGANTVKGLLHWQWEVKPSSMDWLSIGKHST